MTLKPYIYFSIAVIAVVTLYFVKPVSGGLYPPCPFLYLTNLYCPGCGTLRALNSLLHGNLITALDYNPLMVLSIPFVIYLVISNSGIKIKGRLILKPHIFSPIFYRIFIIIIVCFWILRNINIYPLKILAP